MSDVLIVVSSRYGQTRKIAEAIAVDLRAVELTVDVCDVDDPQLGAPTQYRAVVVAASVIAARHAKALVRWVRAHRDHIAARPNAFVSVSLSALSDVPSDRAGLEAVADAFARNTGWRPDRRVFIAGALAYPRYSWFVRPVLRWIAKRHGVSTDTSREHEFTDWAQVHAFAAEIANAWVSPVSPRGDGRGDGRGDEKNPPSCDGGSS